MALSLEEKIAGFLANTRQNFRVRETKNFNLGDTVRWELPKSGLISRAWIQVSGTMTLTDAASDGSLTLLDTMDGKPFGIGTEVRMTVNNGPELIKSPLYHLYLRQLISGRSQYLDVVPAASNAESFVTGNPVYQFGATASAGGTANAWNFTVEVPVGIDERQPIGLFLLQNPDVVAVIEMDTAPAGKMFAMGANDTVAWTGSATLILELMSVPENPDFLPPITKLHKLRFYRQALNVLGDNEFPFVCGNILMRSIERVIINGSRAQFTDITKIKVDMQDGIVKDEIPYGFQLYLQRMRYGRDLPRGVHVLDWNIQGTPGMGLTRDWADTSRLTSLKEYLTVAGSVVLGNGNNFLERLVEELQPLVTE